MFRQKKLPNLPTTRRKANKLSEKHREDNLHTYITELGDLKGVNITEIEKSMKGLCYDCAKKRGIDATEVLANQQDLLSKDKINLADMNKQLENIFKDFAENLDIHDIENIDGAITFGDIDDEDSEDDDE